MKKLNTTALGLLVAVVGVTASAGSTVAAASADTSEPVLVQLLIPDSQADMYELQLGKLAWVARSEGSATVHVDQAVRVVLWRLADCAVLAKFRAQPGSRHLIRFIDGEVVVSHNETAEPMGWTDAGAAPSCSMPDTATIDVGRAPSDDGSSMLLVFSLLAVILFLRPKGRTPRRTEPRHGSKDVQR